MNKDKLFTIGADPEMFLEKDGKLISAEGLVGGTKTNPLPIRNTPYALQEDNVLVEYTIPPASSKENFIKHINFVKQYLTDKFKKDNIKLSDKASGYLDDKYLKSEQACTFGCEADYNVYERAINQPPSQNAKIRTAGGHIHLGYKGIAEINIENTEKIVKAMDLFLGVPSVLMDKDKERKELYGKAGAFRFKDLYGLEYRVLSNFWTLSDSKIEWAYINTIKAAELALSGKLDDTLKENEKDIIKCINEADEALAKKIIEDIISNFY